MYFSGYAMYCMLHRRNCLILETKKGTERAFFLSYRLNICSIYGTIVLDAKASMHPRRGGMLPTIPIEGRWRYDRLRNRNDYL